VVVSEFESTQNTHKAASTAPTGGGAASVDSTIALEERPSVLTTDLTTAQRTKLRNTRKLLVRKGGLEPPRYRYRQPLKLVGVTHGAQ
jgi:hypothetical protein